MTGWQSRGDEIKARLLSTLDQLVEESGQDSDLPADVDTTGYERPERLEELIRQYEYHFQAGQMAELIGETERAAKHYRLFCDRLHDYFTQYWAWVDAIRDGHARKEGAI